MLSKPINVSSLLGTYIKRCIIAEQHTSDGNIIKDIVNKFSAEYTLTAAVAAAAAAVTINKLDAFWKRYNTDKAFKSKMNSSYAYMKQDYFDFLLPFDELREYLKPEFQRAELLLIDRNKASALKISDISSALEIAENVEEFIEMVKTLK